MAVKIRLKRMGNKNRPFYRLMVADSRFPRDGRFLEILGYYDPTKEPVVLEIHREKTLKWLQQGAQMSETARSLLKKKGVYQEFQAIKAGVEYIPPKVEEPAPEEVVETPVAEVAPEVVEETEEPAASEISEAVEEPVAEEETPEAVEEKTSEAETVSEEPAEEPTEESAEKAEEESEEKPE